MSDSDDNKGMPNWVKGILTFLVAATHGFVTGFLISLAIDDSDLKTVAILVGGGFGVLYGLEAGLCVSYDLNGIGWLQLFIDMTWSLPNTIWGFIIGNIIFIFFGFPSRDMSKNNGFIAFKPRGSGSFGNSVLQTHGTVNLGGAGQHELVHVLQARIFGPLFLPIYLVNYIINSLIQGLWTITLGMVLWLVKIREKPYFCPPKDTTNKSVVPGFFGWIYYYTIFEFWGYNS
jgi:hypothetical protein